MNGYHVLGGVLDTDADPTAELEALGEGSHFSPEMLASVKVSIDLDAIVAAFAEESPEYSVVQWIKPAGRR